MCHSVYRGVGFSACITGHMTTGSASGGGVCLLGAESRGLPLGGYTFSGVSASRGRGSASRGKGSFHQGVIGKTPVITTGYGQQVGGMHSTRMHSCW